MDRLLASIDSPRKLKDLSPAEMRRLARELREAVVLTVAKNGGHLASNLGVVELTLALHRSFDFLTDRLVWDVGHQSYIHKLLTGRQAEFPTLRQMGGLSGFPKPEESPYDHFATGHSSTSISAALGMALARDLRGQKHQVVAVIGDGALTSGMAWEALNHAGDLGTNLIVVVNDNEMSISKNVGALSAYLARARTAPAYRRTKADIEGLLKRIPMVGPTLAGTSERLKDSLKYFLVPGMIFEELGFTYLGPVDGHSISSLSTMLEYAKELDGPVLVHCLTTKGKGYRPAEENPSRFHQPGKFNPVNGQSRGSKGRTYSQVFGDTLVRLAADDQRIIAITAAMPEGTGLQPFRAAYPQRFFDVGIAEQHAVTLAAGMAATGMKPVFAVYSTFLQRAYDQVVHDVCLQNLPVLLAIDRAGLVGDDGETHQGVFDLAMLRQMPNITVLAPRDQQELVNLLAWGIEHPGPVAIRYPRGGASDQPLLPPQPVEANRAVCLAQGGEVLLINCGTIWDITQQTAEQLRLAGIEPTVYDVRFVKPLDPTLIEQVTKHRCTVVLEEGVTAGGVGAAILEQLADKGEDGGNVVLIGIPDRFIPHGPRTALLDEMGHSGKKLAERILSRLQSEAKHV
ncbi:MAG: 1-deoxy-D-xylulose-5-phosphate synthase [Bacillota bacterium]